MSEATAKVDSASPNKSSPKCSPTKQEIDTATKALNHFAQGRRHLLVHDIPSAVNALEEACRLLAEQYGETAPECGDAYYYYGRALLELARIESGVLGNALDGEEGSTEGEEEDDDDEESQGEGEGEREGEGEAEGGEENAKEAESQEEEGEKTEEEEDVPNIQLAWEMLEMSKVIFKKQEEEKPEMGLKIGQVYLKLGEVGLESENYAQSIEDFTQCLEIQTKKLKPDDRCLAETHYQLGVAHSFSDDFDKAIDSFKSAASVIEKRIENLLIQKEEKEKWTEAQKQKDAVEREDPFYTEQGEIDELNKLLPEIKEKIVDMEQMKTDSKEKLQKIKGAASFASAIAGTSKTPAPAGDKTTSTESPASITTNEFASSSGSSLTAKPISNISHLVRKKRKPDEEANPEEAKKSRGENGEAQPAISCTNDKVENGQVTENGHTTPEKADSGEKMETEEQPTAEVLKKKISTETEENKGAAAS